MLGQLRFSSVVCVALLGASGISAAPRTLKNLVAFGDSYTDKINVGDGANACRFNSVQTNNI